MELGFNFKPLGLRALQGHTCIARRPSLWLIDSQINSTQYVWTIHTKYNACSCFDMLGCGNGLINSLPLLVVGVIPLLWTIYTLNYALSALMYLSPLTTKSKWDTIVIYILSSWGLACIFGWRDIYIWHWELHCNTIKFGLVGN